LSLVGHSYGGAVALIAALAHPHMLRALVLYEERPGQDAVNEIRDDEAIAQFLE